MLIFLKTGSSLCFVQPSDIDCLGFSNSLTATLTHWPMVWVLGRSYLEANNLSATHLFSCECFGKCVSGLMWVVLYASCRSLWFSLGDSITQPLIHMKLLCQPFSTTSLCESTASEARRYKRTVISRQALSTTSVPSRKGPLIKGNANRFFFEPKQKCQLAKR